MPTPDRAASGTAVGVAMLRAAHLIADGKPPILDDSVAHRLLGPELERRIREHADNFQTPYLRGLRSHVLLRSRFAEDCLAEAVRRGVTQYVLLGAGLDTFAYRQPEWASGLTIIEVDQPASQAAKRNMLADAGIESPRNVRFLDIDFEHESLAGGLARHAVDFTTPTFFSWLGVTMYLQAPAIEAVLRTVAGFPAGSEIVLTFAQPRDEGEASSQAADSAAEIGEPWVSYFTPRALEAELRRCGFGRIEFLDRETATQLYYANRSDELAPPRRVSICRAWV